MCDNLILILTLIIQGKAVITFLDAILDKTLRSTVALIAARGRGKSAALGLAIAGAVAAGLPTCDSLHSIYSLHTVLY